MDYPRKNGATKRQNQEQVRRTLSRKPKGYVEDHEIPAYGERLWFAFWELDSGRGGLEPLTYTEISAYKAAVGVRLDPMEVRCIKAMDNARTRMSAKIEREK